VTHELRTPLTTFNLYAQMLAEGMVPDEKSKREYASTMYKESQRLSRIVESVLHYARLGKPGVIRREVISIEAMIARVTPMLSQRAESGGLACAVDDEVIAEMRELVCDVDVEQVERILGNLVDNSCKYASSGEKLELGYRVESDRLVVSVRDFGPGVPEVDRKAIFKPFARGQAHAHASIPGLGLGLALSRSMAKELGATLEYAPANPGAKFALAIPITGVARPRDRAVA
jgi:signal transduction histidine kinase